MFLGLRLGLPNGSAALFNTTALFQQTGSIGFDFLPADWTTLFQDVNGVTPVTAAGQSVGLMLDRSKGLTLGPELVTNGTFDSGISGWTDASDPTSFISWNATLRAMNIVNNGVNARARQVVTVTVGRFYRVSVANVGAVTFNFVLGSTVGGLEYLNQAVSAGITVTRLIQATTTTLSIDLRNFVGGTATADNVTVTELLGNHATQATAGNRPVSCILPSVGVRNRANGSADVGNATIWRPTTQNGITTTRVGSGFDTDGLPYVDVRYQGTATNTVHDQIYLTTEASQSATSGQSYTASLIARVIAGSTANVAGLLVRSAEFTAPSTFVGIALGAAVTASTDTVTTATRAITTGNLLVASIALTFTNGATIDVTYRIKALQFELGSSRTNYQYNYSQYNVTETPFASVRGIMFNGSTQFMQTPSINFQSFTWDGAAQRNFALGCAQPANEAFWPASAVQNGITATKVGSGFDTDGLPYVDVRYQGTASNTFHTTAYAGDQSRTSSGAVAWAVSFIARVVSGSTTNVSGIRATVREETAPSTFVGNTDGNLVTAATDTQTTVTRTLSTGNQVSALVSLNFTNGATIDVTYRIKGLQLELGSTRTAWQGLGTDEITMIAGLRRLTDTPANQLLAEIGNVSVSSVGTATLHAPGANSGSYGYASRGTIAVSASTGVASFPAPDSAVQTLVAKISTDTMLGRRNGTQVTTAISDQGTGNYSNVPVYIGMRGGTLLPYNGVLTSLVGISRILSTSELAGTEGAANRYLLAY